MKLFALNGFFYLYTLQVGVASFCSWGLGLMSIALIVNFSNILTSFVNADDAIDGTFAEVGVHYAVFFVFLTLRFVAYISAMVGAYQEKPFPMKLAIGFLCLQGIMWLFLTLVSFINVKQLTGFLCVDHLRCADRFFISNANWRYSEEPYYFWNFHPSTDPNRIFRTIDGCWNYCHGLQPDEKTTTKTAPTTTRGPTSTTPGPNTTSKTTTMLPSGKSCTCSKTRVETLLGPLGSTVHLVVSVLFAVLILVFWYGYCFCIFFSYIHYLKTKRNEELSRSSIQTVPSQQEPTRHKSSLKWSNSS